jgi:hypothetical protein
MRFPGRLGCEVCAVKDYAGRATAASLRATALAPEPLRFTGGKLVGVLLAREKGPRVVGSVFGLRR